MSEEDDAFLDDLDQGPAFCGRVSCGVTRGGHKIWYVRSNGAFGQCTASPALKFQAVAGGSYSPYIVTAGHCGEPTDDESWWHGGRYRENTSTIQSYFDIWEARSDPEYSLGTEVANSTELPGIARGDVQVFGAGWHMSSNLLMTSLTTSSHITSIANLSVNDEVCLTALYTSGCDKIENVGWVKTVDGKSVRNLAIVRGSYDAIGGDSGGPLYMKWNSSVIAGFHQGSKTNWIGQEFQLFSQASYLDQGNLGFTDVVAPPRDGIRDFVQNLYWRVLNRISTAPNYWYWASVMQADCFGNAGSVATAFLDSPDMHASVPLTSYENARIRIEYLYRGFLSRESTGGNREVWADMLWNAPNREAMWDSIILAFAQSPNFADRLNGAGSFVDGAVCA